MAEMIRKFIEMNDMVAFCIVIVYFMVVVIGTIYCVIKWTHKEGDE